MIASKIDWSEKEEVPIKQANKYAEKINAALHQTSSKDGTGIQELYQEIAEKLYVKFLAGENVPKKSMKLKERPSTQEVEKPKKKSSC